MGRSWSLSYPLPWRQTRPATIGRRWPPPQPCEGRPGKPRGESLVGRSPKSPWNNNSGPSSTHEGSTGRRLHYRSQKNPMMKLGRKMRRQKARRPSGEDEDCHSQQTYRRVRTIHHHEQEMSISPHALETLVHRHILLQDFLRRAFASVIFAGHGGRLDLRKGEREPLQGFDRRRRAEKQLRVGVYSRPKPPASI